ncbi:MAG TPA: GTPase, partial [Acidimicrobiia bacterium]|nr:GTPase [Acidimicrobiia bacterium]
MPTNVTPEYKAAEAEFRKARTPEDRLHWLREMLRTIPKHKGTEHLQAELKTRVKELTEALAGPRKGGARTGPATVLHAEGAAQVALLGPPNSGKSSLHDRLTGSHAEVGPFPFTTQFPQPGMLPFEDIAFQLIDLPPVSAQHLPPWLPNTLQPAAAALLVVDLGDPDCVEQVEELHRLLSPARVTLTESWEQRVTDDDDENLFAIVLPALLVATKADQLSNPEEELATFRELTGYPYPAVSVSVADGGGLDRLGPFLFEHLGVVRVYTKIPGQPPDMTRPFTVRQGQTVGDVATLVHKDIAADLRYARLWGRGTFDGQQVGRDHALADGDV